MTDPSTTVAISPVVSLTALGGNADDKAGWDACRRRQRRWLLAGSQIPPGGNSMTQELGRIEQPSAEPYKGKRKLFLVPLVYELPTEAEEGQTILARYWEQVVSQVASLESKLGPVKHVYHEAVTEGGTEGLRLLEGVNQRSGHLTQEKSQAGATMEATEDAGLLAEVLDLQRCLSLPFASEKVVLQIQEWFSESVRKRYEHIAQRIDETLQETEVGLLLISERHQVQFPTDVEVFYVSPPALDEYRRWLRGWIARQQAATESGQKPGDDTEPK